MVTFGHELRMRRSLVGDIGLKANNYSKADKLAECWALIA